MLPIPIRNENHPNRERPYPHAYGGKKTLGIAPPPPHVCKAFENTDSPMQKAVHTFHENIMRPLIPANRLPKMGVNFERLPPRPKLLPGELPPRCLGKPRPNLILTHTFD